MIVGKRKNMAGIISIDRDGRSLSGPLGARFFHSIGELTDVAATIVTISYAWVLFLLALRCAVHVFSLFSSLVGRCARAWLIENVATGIYLCSVRRAGGKFSL